MKQPTGMLAAMAGLPGTGKSTIARELERRLGAIVLNKDEIRAELFAERIDFSREQDDLCLRVIFLASKYLFRANPEQIVIIDGRTFSRRYQVEEFLLQARSLNVRPAVIECICEAAIAKQRLESDQRTGGHPAANRNARLYDDLKADAEPVTAPRLVVDTGSETVKACVERSLAYLKQVLK